MNHGVHKVKRRKTNYSTRTFGSASPVYTPFNLDAGFGFPDQNAEMQPNGCTWYTQNELVQDEDKARYQRNFIRTKTLLDTGLKDGPVNVEDSLRVPCVYGALKEGETSDVEAARHARGHYFQLEKQPGMDWFDTAIAMMQLTNSPLSIASPWFEAFEYPIGGVMPDTFPAVWKPGVSGHNHKAYGLTTKNGQPVIIGKSWQGPEFGDGGQHYWTRQAFNRLLDIPGAGAFLLAKWDGSVQTVQYGIIYRLQILIALYQRLIFGS